MILTSREPKQPVILSTYHYFALLDLPFPLYRHSSSPLLTFILPLAKERRNTGRRRRRQKKKEQEKDHLRSRDIFSPSQSLEGKGRMSLKRKSLGTKMKQEKKVTREKKENSSYVCVSAAVQATDGHKRGVGRKKKENARKKMLWERKATKSDPFLV